MGEATTSAQVGEPDLFTARHGHDRPAGLLTEQQREGIHAVAPADLVQPDPGTAPVAHGSLRQGDRQSTLVEVVRRGDETLP